MTVYSARDLVPVFILIIILGVITPCSSQERLPSHTKSGFVTSTDGVKIHYLEVKPRSGQRRSEIRSTVPVCQGSQKPNLLFVPGWMMPGWVWEHQVAHFASDYRVVAMDPRSQGLSEKTGEGLYPAARARDIKSLVDKLGLAPVVLVASTIGVTEVVSYIDQFGTGTVAGLVLVNGIAGREYDEAIVSGLLAYTHSFQVDRQKAAEGFVRGQYRRPYSEAYFRRMVRATLRMPTNSAIALLVGNLVTDNRQALAKIDKPTLIVVARVKSWMQFFEDLHKRIRNSRLEVFEDAGHALFVDEYARFNSLVDVFLCSRLCLKSRNPVARSANGAKYNSQGQAPSRARRVAPGSTRKQP